MRFIIFFLIFCQNLRANLDSFKVSDIFDLGSSAEDINEAE